MRDNCAELRDLAMIDMLASTGMRIGEMVLLNKADINFNERECVVFGKGDKERIVYFDARTKIHLQNYIDSRTDDNPALFITLRSPHERIKIGGIESRLREMGKRLDIPKSIHISSEERLQRWRLIKECRLSSYSSSWDINE